MPKLNDGLKTLKELISDVGTVGAWGVKGAVAAPLADFILRLGPPWPVGVPVLTSLLELLVLLFLITFLQGRRLSVLRRWMLLSTIVTVLGTGLYLMLLRKLVFDAPDGSKVVGGFFPRTDVAPLMSDTYTELDALRGANYDPAEVWTTSSITLAHLVLLTSWGLAFGSLVAAIGLYVLMKRPPPPRAR